MTALKAGRLLAVTPYEPAGITRIAERIESSIDEVIDFEAFAAQDFASPVIRQTDLCLETAEDNVWVGLAFVPRSCDYVQSLNHLFHLSNQVAEFRLWWPRACSSGKGAASERGRLPRRRRPRRYRGHIRFHQEHLRMLPGTAQ